MRRLIAILLCSSILWGCSSLMAGETSSSEVKSMSELSPVFSPGKDLTTNRLTFVYGDRPLAVPACEKVCETAWGIVVLLEYDGRKILFNAGGDEAIMRKNMAALHINPKELDAVVISHHHWEMIDGLGAVLAENPNLPVYVTETIVEDYGKSPWAKNFKVVNNRLRLSQNVMIMNLQSQPREGGPFGIPELHIVVKTKEGLTILMGCGHPRVVNIMQKSIAATNEKRVYLIAGGTRLLRPGKTVKMPGGKFMTIPQMIYYTDDDYRQIADTLFKAGVKKIIPTHCTSQDAEGIFKQKFGDGYIFQTLGMKLDLPPAE